MKKNLHRSLIILAGIFFLSANVKAQTTINIQNAGDSMTLYCYSPIDITFTIDGLSTGYLPGTDTLSIYINFGDGTDTTILFPVTSNPWFFTWLWHTYQFPGNYSAQYIVTGPDGNADTVTVMNDIVIYTNCGNIDGQLYIDANSNCIFDGGETAVQSVPVQLLLGTTVIATTNTDSNGVYHFFAGNNNYTVRPAPQWMNYGYTVTCPVSAQINIPSVPSYNNNFGLVCNPGFDLTGTLGGWGFRPATTGFLYPTVLNMSCLPMSGQAKLILDDPLITYTGASITPNAISGDTIIWNFSNVTNLSGLDLSLVYVMISPSAVIGDTVCFTLLVEPTAGDLNMGNNTIVFCSIIRNACDPNEKYVTPSGSIAPGSWLTYTINFQNTGNDTAYNVFILDTLDSNLDRNTFLPLAASHPFQTYMQSGEVVKFAFDNIMLPDSNINEPLSHGWITYRIKSLNGLPAGTLLHNTAYIYFDFNAAIVTNTTSTMIADIITAVELNSGLFSLQIYPNPATSQLAVSSKLWAINSVEIYDVVGVKVKSIVVSSPLSVAQQLSTNNYPLTIDVSTLSPGIYFVKVRGEIKERVAKFVKQ